MITLLGEGLESAFFPCSLALLVPGLLAMVAGQRSPLAAGVGFTVGAFGVAWLRFTSLIDEPTPLGVFVLFAGAAVIFVAPHLALKRAIPTGSAIIGAGALLTGAAAGSIWAPCVGSSFGNLLGALPERNPADLARLGSYTIGVLAPLAVVGAALYSIPTSWSQRYERVLGLGSAGAIALASLAAATGRLDSLISQLVAWSI